jgi:hypothetical protein
VAYSCDLGYVRDYAVLRIYECVEDHADSDLVVRHGLCGNELILACGLICELTVDSDSLGITLCEYIACIDIEKLELCGRTTAVDN